MAVSGRGISTCRKRSSTRSRRSALGVPKWMRSASPICSPIRCTGDSELIGSWKIIAISRPRTLRISSPRGLSLARSTWLPSCRVSTIEPPSIVPGLSTICRIERAVTDLPEPLSPTTQSVLPRLSLKETPSTALNTPVRVLNEVWRSSTLRMVSLIMLIRRTHKGRRRRAIRRQGS